MRMNFNERQTENWRERTERGKKKCFPEGRGKEEGGMHVCRRVIVHRQFENYCRDPGTPARGSLKHAVTGDRRKFQFFAWRSDHYDVNFKCAQICCAKVIEV